MIVAFWFQQTCHSSVRFQASPFVAGHTPDSHGNISCMNTWRGPAGTSQAGVHSNVWGRTSFYTTMRCVFNFNLSRKHRTAIHRNHLNYIISSVVCLDELKLDILRKKSSPWRANLMIGGRGGRNTIDTHRCLVPETGQRRWKWIIDIYKFWNVWISHSVFMF